MYLFTLFLMLRFHAIEAYKADLREERRKEEIILQHQSLFLRMPTASLTHFA
jgi:hypothetical protein